MKICPNCGSENIDWITPYDWTLWVCKRCDYVGQAIDGNEVLIKEINDRYIERLKEEKKFIKKSNKGNSSNLIKTKNIGGKKLKKMCPNCGSDNIDWMYPQVMSFWFCMDCGYT